MKRLFTLILLSLFLGASAQHLIPTPVRYELKSDVGINPSQTSTMIVDDLKPEEYMISISEDSITIRGGSNQAIVWANSTLSQLKHKDGTYPQVFIHDYPAFDFRAFMYDSGRNFVEVDMIKQFIDLISSYKLNVFHWHLTDNPAWRIECKIYPQLNDPKFQRKGRDEGRFYTYNQIRDVIAYAKERGVIVVPEIDMPGHSEFFNKTFGFSMDSKEGIAVLEKCLDEFFNEISVEDCPYFHVGSDEIHIADPTGFMKWSEIFVAKYNRKPIAWDPGLPSSETTIRQIWNQAAGANSAAATQPGKYLDSFMGYLNYYDPILFVSKNFLHNPCGTGKQTDNAMGGILCLWNDVRVTDKSRLMPHNGVLGGVMAFSERFWCGGNVGHNGSENLMPDPKSEAGIALKDFETRLAYHHNNYFKNQMYWTPNSDIEWIVSEPIAMGVDTTNLKWHKAWGGVIDVEEFAKKYNCTQSDSMDLWAKTKIDANADTTIKVWFGFEVCARSNRIGNGIPLTDQWDCGGKIWVNGKELQPNKDWVEPGKYKYHFHTWHKPQEEEPFTDEQFYWMREPIEIKLAKGNNNIELYAPKRFQGQRWTFSFMPIQ